MKTKTISQDRNEVPLSRDHGNDPTQPRRGGGTGGGDLRSGTQPATRNETSIPTPSGPGSPETGDGGNGSSFETCRISSFGGDWLRPSRTSLQSLQGCRPSNVFSNAEPNVPSCE